MKGIITLDQMIIPCWIGVYPHEHHQPQPISFFIQFEIPVPQKDFLDYTVDYDQVYTICQKVAQKQSFQLIESLAYIVYDALITQLFLEKLVVRVSKTLPIGRATFQVGHI